MSTCTGTLNTHIHARRHTHNWEHPSPIRPQFLFHCSKKDKKSAAVDDDDDDDAVVSPE